MDILSNQFIINNIASLGGMLLLSFVISFLLTPVIGRLAKWVGAVDLPKDLRAKNERGFSTRLHTTPKLKLGGVAMAISILIVLILTGNLFALPKGIILGAIVICIGGIIDDIWELKSTYQLMFHVVAALCVIILSGISITSINVLQTNINFNWFSVLIEIGRFGYNFVFPADLITIVWIVGMINVINWVGGVDALNGSVTSIALATILLFAVSSGNIVIAGLIAVHLGSVLGVLPFNYYPSKIFYGSAGDYLNGFLLAIFAIFAGTRWTATILLLAMPIIDAVIVIYTRFKQHPELFKNPLKLFSISDRNHLHHRLLAAGYTPKMVTLIEITIMVLICAIAIFFSNLRQDLVAIIAGGSLLLTFFTLVFFLKKNKERRKQFSYLNGNSDEPIKPVVNVIYKDDEDSEEKFVY